MMHLSSARQRAQFPHHCIQPPQRLRASICTVATLSTYSGGFVRRLGRPLGAPLAAGPLCAACRSASSSHGRL